MWRNRRRDQDFHQEIDAHIALETDRLIAAGMAPEEARAAARRTFGNITMTQEQFHETRGAAFLDRLAQDLRYTIRSLRRNPGLTAAVIATLAIGVGANTAIFSVMRGVILRPLPYESPEQLVMVWRVGKNTPPPGRGIVTSLYALEWRARNECFSDVALLEPRDDVDAAGLDGTERFRSFLVTPNFFALMGVAATRGRTFTEDDPPDVVVLSHGMWQRRFGSDPGIVGQRIELTTGFSPNRESRLWTVVGVMPPSFRFSYPQDTDLWIPYSWDELKRRNAATLGLQVIARVKPGMTLASAQAHMNTVMTAMGRSLSSSYGMSQEYRQVIQNDISQSSVRLETVQDYVVGQTRPAFVLLALVTIFLLGVACVNVACLIVARTAGRSREIAVRLALGGGSARIRFQLFIEGLVLALMGGLAGITMAAALQPILRASIPLAFPRADEVQFDLSTTAWGLGLALIAAIVAGLAPTLSLSTINVNAMLRQGGPTATSDRRSTWWRQSLVAGQVALVMTILIVSGLLLHTLWRLQRVNLGFTSSDVLVVHLRTGTPATQEWRERLMTRLRSVPGILDVGVGSAAPMRSGVLPMVSGQGGMQTVVTRSGRQSVFLVSADTNYFKVLGIPLRTGRLFGTDDGRSDEFVALLSDAAARSLFSDEDPIGKTIALPPWGTARIVGVLADVRYRRVDEPTAPVVYVPFAQRPHGNMVLVVRTADGLTATPAAIRAVVREVDPKQPIESMATLDALVTDSIADRRFYAVSTMAFSMVALLLTAAGLYGVVSRGVVEQVREIGIRMALGAQRGHLIRLIMRQGLLPVGVGLVAGGIGVTWASNLLRRFLFEVEPLDALTFLGVPALVLLVAAAACAIPAYRALRVNPIEAIRAN